MSPDVAAALARMEQAKIWAMYFSVDECRQYTADLALVAQALAAVTPTQTICPTCGDAMVDVRITLGAPVDTSPNKEIS